MRLYVGGAVYRRGRIERVSVSVDKGRIVGVSDFIDPRLADQVIDLQGKLLTPGFVDVHVHLREPGFFYKETIATGTLAAARGGYTAVCAMPNIHPAPDNPDALAVTLDAIRRSARVNVYPYGCLTIGRAGRGDMADFKSLLPNVCGFSDDGTGIQDEELMRRLMWQARETGALIAAHCEDETLVKGGCIHDGEYARTHGLPGICSKSEWGQIERDLRIAGETGCRYHVCHISALESVELIRSAKARGVDASCETAPHYLLLCDEDLADEGRFKMNPPIRAREDREALIEGLCDGTIDMIATDHAPHTAEEKSGGLLGSLMGVVGLDTAFPMLYEHLVLKNVISLEKLLSLMCDAPRARFKLPGGIETGESADLAVWDLEPRYRVDPDEFASMGRATPFAGMWARGRCVETVVAGKTVWEDER